MLIDIHAHHASLQGEWVNEQAVHSLGIHPWDITAENADILIDEFDKRLVHNLFISIGECGLDKLCQAPMPLQERLFRHQIAKSEERGLPLLIHGVKAQDELLRIKKQLSPRQPWIFHGFRGKPQQLQQLLAHGFYLSFGLNYNRESLKACSLDHLFLETDDICKPVSIIYNKVAEDLELSLSTLERQIEDNFVRLFPHFSLT